MPLYPRTNVSSITATNDVTSTDDVIVGDDLNVTGLATIGETLAVAGDVTFSKNSGTITIGTTNPVVFTHGTNSLTLAASDTLAITTADKLTVNSVIVPTIMVASFEIKPHATVTEWDLMVAPRALQVTRIDVVPSTLEGGALTATICKATGTSAPANGTTPMHTANSINLNTGAYTVQNVTLTVTTADLQLATGNRIGIDMSGAVGTAHFCVTISYMYI